MSSTEGKTLTCDLCGKSVFLKYVGTKDFDGGFTRVREYEDRPDGWTRYSVPKIALGDLCPECAEQIQNALLECIGKIKNP